MKDRIRELRKLLGLNQTEFGRKIGLSQKPISEMEQGGNITERNFEAICREFSVNPKWLRDGVGEIFLEQKEAILKMLVHEFDLTPDEKSLVAAFLELPREYRAGVIEYVKKTAAVFEAQEAETKKAARKPDSDLTRDEMHAILDVELDAAEKRKMFSASTGSSGSSSKKLNGSS